MGARLVGSDTDTSGRHPVRLIISKSKDKTPALLNEIKRKGYNPEYKILSGSKNAARSASKEKWDVILADYKPSDDKL